jgi:hypothetical protein
VLLNFQFITMLNMFLQKQEEYIVVDSAGDKKFFVICGACSVSHFCNVKTFLLNVGIFFHVSGSNQRAS